MPFLAQQRSEGPGMEESQSGGADDGESAAVTAFLEFMDKTPEEHAFDAFLGSRGMTQEEFEALPENEKQALLEEFKEAMKRQIEERSEEHTSELQSLMRISYAVFCLKKKNHNSTNKET